MERFKTGRISVVDEDRPSSLTTLRTAENIQWVHALIQEDRRVTIIDIADKLDISCVSAYSIIHEVLG
jgi:hypothetical protein